MTPSADRVPRRSREVGKQADLVTIDLRRPHLVPACDLAGAMVWQANGSDVSTVIVAGDVVLHGGILAFLRAEDEAALLVEAAERSALITTRAGL